MKPMQYRKLADEVTDILRTMILTGELRSERTTQDELAKLLQVSTTPVRESLLRLAAEGFVQIQPNRSFKLLPITRNDIRDIYWIHATLAGELTARACEIADNSILDVLEKQESLFLECRQVNDTIGMEKANWQFHATINKAAESPKLLMMLLSSLRYIPDGFYALVKGWSSLSEQGHIDIIEAFRLHDPNKAREAAKSHVFEAGELLIDYFSSTGYWTSPSA